MGQVSTDGGKGGVKGKGKGKGKRDRVSRRAMDGDALVASLGVATGVLDRDTSGAGMEGMNTSEGVLRKPSVDGMEGIEDEDADHEVDRLVSLSRGVAPQLSIMHVPVKDSQEKSSVTSIAWDPSRAFAFRGAWSAVPSDHIAWSQIAWGCGLPGDWRPP